MRRLLLVIALGACGYNSSGPAWPKSTPRAGVEDGGESLAPRPSAHELAAPDGDDEVAQAPVPAATTPKPAAPAATETAPAATTPTEETTTTEEITIEIEDD